MLNRETAVETVRDEAKKIATRRQIPLHVSNGEESDYRNAAGELSYIANFHKGLDHNALGEVIPQNYRAMVRAFNSGSSELFDTIPLGLGRKLTNPQAGLD